MDVVEGTVRTEYACIGYIPSISVKISNAIPQTPDMLGLVPADHSLL
jgi:hypothetical protein